MEKNTPVEVSLIKAKENEFYFSVKIEPVVVFFSQIEFESLVRQGLSVLGEVAKEKMRNKPEK